MNAGTVGCGPVFCLMGPLFISLNASSIASWYFPSNTICRTCGNTSAALGASKGLFHGTRRLSWWKRICSEYGSHVASIFMCPLPEVSPSLTVVPGIKLQNPCNGTMPRRSRSSSGIGETLTSGDRCDAANSGILGRNLPFRARRRNAEERISAGTAALPGAGVGFCASISLALSGWSNPVELASPTAIVPFLRKSLRLIASSSRRCNPIGS